MTTMERRDFILSIIATGLSASLAPMALARTLDPSLPLTPRTSPEPPDFGTVDIQLLLAGIFPERNLVITDQYAGVQIEILYLGLRRLEQFRALLERNRDYAVSMDQGMVAIAFKERSELFEASEPEVQNLDLDTGVLIRDHEIPFGKDTGQQELDIDGAEVWWLRRGTRRQRQRGVQSPSQRHWGERGTEARGDNREDEVAPFHSGHAEPPNGSRLSCGALKKDSFPNLRAPPASSAC